MDTGNWISLAAVFVALGALFWAIWRDGRTDVRQSLTRIEDEVRKLGDRVGAVETRLAVVETKVEDLRQPWPLESIKAVAAFLSAGRSPGSRIPDAGWPETPAE